jgi:phosphoribosyl-AMP cyclohydrolase
LPSALAVSPAGSGRNDSNIVEALIRFHFRGIDFPMAYNVVTAAAGESAGATMSDESIQFHARRSIEQVEEGTELAPKFDDRGLIAAVTTDASTGELLMQGYMNAEALRLTISTGEAHYFSRSRQCVWHKGATSGLVQKVQELLIDDDQDCVWLRVLLKGGASCHVGYRSCFYRRIPIGTDHQGELVFTDTKKVFDPKQVYGDTPNPTVL